MIAGTLTMIGRVFSFVAVREGTRLDLEGDTGTAGSLAPAKAGGHLAPGPGRARAGPLRPG